MTAVDLGSFSKASEVVGYTQSGLTHLVDSLEREIGLTLVRRDHSGIALTEEGEALMPAIREFLRANAKLENRIAAITENRPGPSASRPTRASPCAGCRRSCTASAASARISTWTCGRSTMSSSRLSCWKMADGRDLRRPPERLRL